MLPPWGLGDLPTHGLGWLLFPEQHTKEDRLAHRPQETPWGAIRQLPPPASGHPHVVTTPV